LNFLQPKIRMVLATDLNDILDISSHVWEGYDYLPFVIEEWLKDSNCYTYATEVNGHVVGIGNLRLVEKGRTGWLEGLRIHPNYRGKGLARAITEHIIKHAQRLHVERLRYTTGSENQASLKLAEKTGFVRVLEMGVFWHPNPNDIPFPRNYPPIEISSPKKIFELTQETPELNSHGILIYDWKALDSTLEGFVKVGKSNEFYISLRKGKLDSYSFGKLRSESKESMWSFTIYANQNDGFISHLSHQITLASRNQQKAIMCIYETKFEKALHDLEWQSNEHWKMHLVLVEKTMS